MAAENPEDVAQVLERLRAGVRQRQAELMTLGGGEERRLRLLDLKTKEFIQEPVAVSPRPGIGPLLVFWRKVAFHLVFKWWVRPVLHQQNELNRALSGAIQELGQGQEKLAQAVEALARRLSDLERDSPRQSD